MLFGGFFVKRAAIKATMPLIRTLERFGGLPENFWGNPYALGFLVGVILSVQVDMRGDRAKKTATGMLIVDVFSSLVPTRTQEVSKLIGILSTTNNPDFIRGANSATKCFLFGSGRKIDEDDPDIQRARKAAASLPGILPDSTKHSRVSGALLDNLFYKVVQENSASRSNH